MKKSIRVLMFLIIIFALALIFGLIFFLNKPKIYLKGSDQVTINYGEHYKESGYNASFLGFDLSNKISINDDVDYDKIGKYEINYKINDIVGLFSEDAIREVIIVDNEPPIIELVDDTILLKLGEEYIEPGYQAGDNYDGNITNKVIVENNVDTSNIGEYEIVYKVLDSSSNETVKKRSVIVYEHNVASVPILTYHHFMTSEEKKQYMPYDKYVMSTEMFEKQLNYLKENGYNSITLDDLYSWYIGKKVLSNKDIVITIDDGNISAYKYAIPLLEKYGFKATIFVITGRIKNEERVWDPSILQFFNDNIINDVLKNHQSITLSSHTHYLHSTINGVCSITSKTEEEIYNDVKTSKEIMNSDYLAYPFGCHTSDSNQALKQAGYKMAFEFGDDKRATKDNDIYALKRININSYTTMNDFKKWLEE